MQGCDSTRNQEFALGELGEKVAARHRLHLAGCPHCRVELEQFQELFGVLRQMPPLPVPNGIPEAVLARLAPAGPIRSYLGVRDPAVRSPLLAAVAGVVAGVLLGLFRNPLLLLFGDFARELLTFSADGLLRWISGGSAQVSAVGPLLRVSAQLLLLLRKLAEALVDVIRTLPGQIGWESALLALLTLLVLGRFIASTGRESIGHVEHS